MDSDEATVPRWFHVGLVVSVAAMADVAAFIFCGILPAMAAAIVTFGALGVWLRTTYRADHEPRAASVPVVITTVTLLVLLTECWWLDLPALITAQSPWSAPAPADFNQTRLIAGAYAGIAVLLTGAYLAWIRHPLGAYLAWLAFLTGGGGAVSLWIYPLIGGIGYVPGMATSLLTAAAGGYGVRILRQEHRAALATVTTQRGGSHATSR